MMIEVFATILVVIAIILVVVAVILVVLASIVVVIAAFTKNKGPEFEIFFQKFKKGIFFSPLNHTSQIVLKFNASNFTNTLFFCRYLVPDVVKFTSKRKQYW